MLTAGPHYTVFLLGSTRFLLVSFDKSVMFLGFCFAFIFFGATFVSHLKHHFQYKIHHFQYNIHHFLKCLMQTNSSLLIQTSSI